jgi:hypothetical protein
VEEVRRSISHEESTARTRCILDSQRLLQLSSSEPLGPTNERVSQASDGSSASSLCVVIPFQVDLPAFLPPSYETECNGSRISLRYTIKASVSGSDQYAEAKIRIVGAPFTKFSNGILPPPFYHVPRTHEMTRCCVIGKGAVTFSLALSTVLADRGSTIRVKLAGIDQSQFAPVEIRVCLVQSIRDIGYLVGGVPEVLCETFYPSDCLAAKTGEPSQDVAASPFLSTLLDALRSAGSGSQEVSLTVPTTCLPSSYEGGQSVVSHAVVFSIDTGSGLFNNPNLSIPVRIVDHMTPPAINSVTPDVANEVDQSSPAKVSLRLEPKLKASVEKPEPEIAVNQELEPDIGVNLESSQKSFTERMHQLGTISPSRSVAIEIAYNSDADEFRQWIQSLPPRDFAFLAAKQSYQLMLWLAQRHTSLTCEHVVRLLRCDSGCCCSVVVELLLPYAIDLATNHHQIIESLSEWDRMVVQLWTGLWTRRRPDVQAFRIGKRIGSLSNTEPR